MSPRLFLSLLFLSSLSGLSTAHAEESTALPQSPKILQEQELSGRDPVGGAFAVTPESVERMLGLGAPHLALRVVEKAMERGGAPLGAQRWRGLRAAALVDMGRPIEGLEILEGLPPANVQNDPRLLLALAQAYRATEACPKARPLFSRFLLDHPTHPQRFRAQRDSALCALSAGALEEAELQLQLYEQETERPHPDPWLTLGLADLAERRGEMDRALELMHDLDKASAQTLARLPVLRRLARRLLEATRHEDATALWRGMRETPDLPPDLLLEARQALMEIAAHRQAWPETLLEAERLLREGAGKGVLENHARWFLAWAAQPEPTLASTPPPPSPDPPPPPDMPPKRVDGQPLPGAEPPPPPPPPPVVSPEERELRERLELLRIVRDPAHESLTRWQALEQLLRRERGMRLGLLAPGGLLTPETLGLPHPLPLPLRLLYAGATIRFGMSAQAQKLVEGVEGMEADAVRLMLLAQGNAVPGVTVGGLMARYAPERGGLPPMMMEAAVEALNAFSERGVEVVAQQLRQVLAGYAAGDPAVARALRYEEALRLRRDGQHEQALWLLLELGFGKEGGERDNRLLPGDPHLLAASWLSRMGWLREAGELQPPSTPGR